MQSATQSGGAAVLLFESRLFHNTVLPDAWENGVLRLSMMAFISVHSMCGSA
jgi:hypothetical protein